MTKHMTGTREEWLAARLELLEAEKELTRKSDELARRRPELPCVRIDEQYRFETDEGSASLAGLFRGRSQLLVYHFMFGPEFSAGCPSCSAIADGFNGSGMVEYNFSVREVAAAASSTTPIPPIRADWTASGACTSGSTAPPRDETRRERAPGGAATTSTRAECGVPPGELEPLCAFS